MGASGGRIINHKGACKLGILQRKERPLTKPRHGQNRLKRILRERERKRTAEEATHAPDHRRPPRHPHPPPCRHSPRHHPRGHRGPLCRPHRGRSPPRAPSVPRPPLCLICSEPRWCVRACAPVLGLYTMRREGVPLDDDRNRPREIRPKCAQMRARVCASSSTPSPFLFASLSSLQCRDGSETEASYSPENNAYAT